MNAIKMLNVLYVIIAMQKIFVLFLKIIYVIFVLINANFVVIIYVLKMNVYQEKYLAKTVKIYILN
jgi:hypothetical protein